MIINVQIWYYIYNTDKLGWLGLGGGDWCGHLPIEGTYAIIEVDYKTASKLHNIVKYDRVLVNYTECYVF